MFWCLRAVGIEMGSILCFPFRAKLDFYVPLMGINTHGHMDIRTHGVIAAAMLIVNK